MLPYSALFLRHWLRVMLVYRGLGISRIFFVKVDLGSFSGGRFRLAGFAGYGAPRGAFISWTSCSRPSLCNDRCRFWSRQCSAFPVETPQVQFLDEVIVIMTGFIVQTVQTVWRFLSCSSSSRTLTSLVVALRQIPVVLARFHSLPYSWWFMSLLCSSTSLSRRRVFFSCSRRFVGPSRFPLAPQDGDRCPFSQVVQVLHIAVEA